MRSFLRIWLHLLKKSLMENLVFYAVKGLGIIKIAKQIKFNVTRGELEAKKRFHRQSWTKYLRQTLVFM